MLPEYMSSFLLNNNMYYYVHLEPSHYKLFYFQGITIYLLVYRISVINVFVVLYLKHICSKHLLLHQL